MSTALATPRTILDLIDEYDQKSAGVQEAIEAFHAATSAIESASCIMGTYVGPALNGHASAHPQTLQANLLKSGWKAIYNRLNIDQIASANDKRLFERTLENPPPLTPAAVRATFAHYYANPRLHILRGLAEVFADLDPAYRSHSKVKIGVKGLPKRIILHNVGGYSSYGKDKLRDILNALAAYQGKPLTTYTDLSLILEDGEALRYDREIPEPNRSPYAPLPAKLITITGRDVWLKRYGNGNGHLYFGPTALRDINRGLAEFYGEVLPDAEPSEPPSHRPSTDVSKDLQFYWSPPAVIDAALEYAGVHSARNYSGTPPTRKVLEPSCGDGRILDELKERNQSTFGIEYHAGRAAEARAKGHSVLTANFLECPARAEYDVVVMNPPFSHTHYLKHLRHALGFLVPGGTLVSILPATAWYDHGELVGTLAGDWKDLPVGSFSEVGTNVPTGLLRIRVAA